LDTGDPLGLLLMIGTNIFGVYALYKIAQEIYAYIKNQTSDDEF